MVSAEYSLMAPSEGAILAAHLSSTVRLAFPLLDHPGTVLAVKGSLRAPNNGGPDVLSLMDATSNDACAIAATTAEKKMARRSTMRSGRHCARR
jgi:hypothetical protein